ncbi:hypothetical protein KP509_28G038300 [Ceratopteris richardii]|uniref:Uncharacterized protein n=1 Tax=Ceratopteris richardii TaxID=49495 RepID=A0A8T2RB97_CERRI|nr:hypothetical protein KP509_28G038300 [Ceratopteris richardii]
MWRKGIEHGGASPVGPTSSRIDGGAKSVSTSTIPTEPRKPTWYRYRTILMSSLVLEQQELFQWILSEKRKMKAKTKAEKGQIDAEKALLKEFIKGKKAFDV